MTMFMRADRQWATPPTSATAGGPEAGVAVVPFPGFANEGTVVVVGQGEITAMSCVCATIVADNDDVVAQDWFAPTVSGIVPGVGFTIMLRPAAGTFSGNVMVHWTWK